MSYLSKCKRYKYKFPNFNPQILNLSKNTSASNEYTQVTITGYNFSFGSTIGRSTVNFGSYVNLPVTFYGSTAISFVVPINAVPGNYSIQVVNLLYPTSLYSNQVTYILTQS